MGKRALITGITGQDGSYLAELLLAKGYEVFGLERRASRKNRTNIAHIERRLQLISGDLLDEGSLVRALLIAQPDEVYNLGAQTFVPESWKQPIYTAEVSGLGALRLLEAVRQVNPKMKFYQASTSEMFGKVQAIPQNEKTPFYPRSPYGFSKLVAHWATVNYRESYGIFAVSGILFNHESPRRGYEFLTRKVSNAAARISLGLDKELMLGNLEAKRDWGYAGDYVEAVWRMLQAPSPSDYVIATGIQHSVQEFVEKAFSIVGLDWKRYVKTSSEFLRPAESDLLVGDASKAKKELGWVPRVNFDGLVKMMVESDLVLNKGSQLPA
ncbi:MAG: GDP-mannose 4,6-dehydratase [Minisyncoccia bacterium]|jgi:GDPmannose 4,6-dehydratase